MLCRMQKKMPEAMFGPHIAFREWTLLDNPRMPSSFKAEALQIKTCQVRAISRHHMLVPMLAPHAMILQTLACGALPDASSSYV